MMVFISLVIFVPMFGFSQLVQPASPEDIATLNKIQLEHSNTRKFMSSEITRNKDVFFKDFDSRANYYEETFFSTLNTAIWKLSLLFGGIIFFAISINHILSIKLEKNKYKKLKKSLKEEIGRDLISLTKGEPKQQQRNEVMPEPQREFESIVPNTGNGDIQQDRLFNPSSPPQNYNQQSSNVKKTFSQRRQEKKAMKKIQKLEKYEQQIQLEKQKLIRISNLGNAVGMELSTPQSNQNIHTQQKPRQPQQQSQQPNVEYKFEVDY